MINLVLAQGADHTKPENLKKIVETIAIEKQRMMPKAVFDPYLYDTFNIHTEVSTMSYSVEEKYDGFSYLNTEGRFFSKRLSQAKGSEGVPTEKTDHIPHLSRILKSVYELCGADLHGELYKIGGISDDVTRIMGCTVDEAIRRQQEILNSQGTNGMLHFMLIDIRAFRGKSLINEPHRIRRAILKYVYDTYIVPADVHQYIRLTEELTGDPRDEFRRIVKSGGEGIIIKRENGLYIPGKKPANNWIKGKKKITHDVFMVGFNAGTGKNIDIFGSIRFAHIVDGKEVECGNCSSGLSDDMRAYIYHNADKLIANKQVFEIEAIQESVKSFRNAVFLRLRDDKDWSECNPVRVRIKEELI